MFTGNSGFGCSFPSVSGFLWKMSVDSFYSCSEYATGLEEYKNDFLKLTTKYWLAATVLSF